MQRFSKQRTQFESGLCLCVWTVTSQAISSQHIILLVLTVHGILITIAQKVSRVWGPASIY